jgi:pimeloyl-ACP methyl ester carboxylesterase
MYNIKNTLFILLLLLAVVSKSHSSDQSSDRLIKRFVAMNEKINNDNDLLPDAITDISIVGDATTSDYTSIGCGELTDPVLVHRGHIGNNTVECGQVTVPADWSGVNGGIIKLAVYRIPSTSPTPAPDPVVYLAGGPGGSGALRVRSFSTSQKFAYLRERSDIIVIDQRGTGYSEPALFCPEVFKAKAERGNVIAAHQACHDRFTSQGVRFSDYNSSYNAQDINAVREALGYPEWNLYGVSYGTRLALTVMRDLPNGVRSVVLDSVFPPEVNGMSEFAFTRSWAIKQIATNCAADADCSTNIGDIKGLIEDGIDRLSVPVGKYTARDYVSVLALSVSQPKLPSIISLFARGPDDKIIEFMQIFEQSFPGAKANEVPAVAYPFHTSSAGGMHRAVMCSEEEPYLDISAGPAIVGNLRESTRSALKQIGQRSVNGRFCDIYTVPARGEIETLPVESSIPTLVLADTNDATTPPAWSKLAADSLENSQYAEFKGFGHSLLGRHNCINQITLNFLNNPDLPADQRCINSLPRVNYITN